MRSIEENPEAPPQGPIGVIGLVGPEQWGRWKTAVANVWRQPGHINVLEMYAESLGIDWVLRKGSPATPRRLIFLQDSQVVVGASTKGRSSSSALMRPLRRSSASMLAGFLWLERLWIPSKANPADGPSRGRAIGAF